MPKLPLPAPKQPDKPARPLLSTLVCPVSKSSPAQTYIVKTHTDRAKAVIAIWDGILAPSKKFPTEEEQLAYLEGVLDEKRRQDTYDSLLREAGLR